MSVLTSRQRDILRMLCEARRPLAVAEIANRLHLTTRQVHYCLQGIRAWLRQHDHDLSLTPEAGVQTTLPLPQARRLFAELDQQAAEAIQSVIDSRYPGKVLIFPQIPSLPLTSLQELPARLPAVAAKLGEDRLWTTAAEETLIDELWPRPESA